MRRWSTSEIWSVASSMARCALHSIQQNDPWRMVLSNFVVERTIEEGATGRKDAGWRRAGVEELDGGGCPMKSLSSYFVKLLIMKFYIITSVLGKTTTISLRSMLRLNSP